MSYTLYWDGRTISSYSGTLPTTLDLSAVTNPDTSQTALAIGSNCFLSNTEINSVIFGNDLLNIAGFAFAHCSTLKYISFGNSLSTIEIGAFAPDQLVGFEFPNTLTGIGSTAFSGNNISSITIPNSVTNIGSFVFNGNTTLSSIIIGTGLSTIPTGAFNGCGLKSLVLPGNITTIESNAFAFNQISSLVLPNTITSIGFDSFGGNTALSSLSIGSGLSTITGFSGCGLRSLEIPSNIISIGDSAFSGNQISSITIPNTVASIGLECFASMPTLSSISIGTGLSTITGACFFGCSLVSLEIPNNITGIDYDAFAGNQISSLTIPNSITSIGTYAFTDNTTLSSISIGSGLTLIDEGVFSNSHLVNLTIPNTITAINQHAFQTNPILTTVTVQNAASNISINAAAFDPGVTINYTGGGGIPSTPQIFIRPKPYPNSIVYQVNSNAQFTSSINLIVTGPGGGEYSFVPTSHWYRYTVTGLTISSNYSAVAYQTNSGGVSSLTTTYRTVQTGYLPGPVQNLNGTVNGLTATLDWNFSSSNGDATIKWHVIRDLSSNIKYNVPGTISTYTAPLLVNPGINLFSVEAVNDPGYSTRMYWSTLVV